MIRHAKASFAGSNSSKGKGLGSLFRGALVTSGNAGGSNATAHRGGARLIAFLCFALALTAACTASPALAITTHPYITSFGPNNIQKTDQFANLQGLAVDQANGDVYALDAGDGGKIYKFNSAGQPLNFSGLAGNVIEGVGGGGFRLELALAPAGSPGGTAGDIYIAHDNRLAIYAPSGAKIGEIGSTGEGAICGVATNPAGHVFVGVNPSTVQEYTPTANPLTEADKSGASNAEMPGICNVAADGLGNVYAANSSGYFRAVKLEGLSDTTPASIQPGGATLVVDPATNDFYLDTFEGVTQYDSSGVLIRTFGGDQLSASFGIAVNGATNEVYAGNGGSGKIDVFGAAVIVPGLNVEPLTGLTGTKVTLNATVNPDGVAVSECRFEYGTTSAYGSSKPCAGAIPADGKDHPVSATLTGLSADTEYHFRITAVNANGTNRSLARTFTTEQVAVTGPASAINPPTATIEGTLNPEGSPFAACSFEYGTTTGYGSSVPCTESPASIGTGSAPVSVHAALNGLAFGTTYYYRLTANRADGTFKGRDQSFQTPGAVIEDQYAASVSDTQAHLVVRINPKGLPTTFHIEYGTNGSYGQSTEEATVGSDENGQTLTVSLEGLTPDTTYHWRAVATNSAGVSKGADLTFATAPLSAGGLPEGRVYEMVSPALKIGEVFPPEPVENLGGSRSCETLCQPGTTNPLMPIQTDPTGEALSFVGQPFAEGLAPSSNQYISRRSPSGWGTRDITPLRADKNSGFQALAPDFTRGVLLQTLPALSSKAPIGENGRPFQNLYLWEESNPDLLPLVTAEPPHRIATYADFKDAFQLSFGAGNSGASGTPAFTHLVFEANDALTPAVPNLAPAAPEAEGGECGDNLGFNERGSRSCDIYEWVGGQLRLVNVLPGNAAAAGHAVLGSGGRLGPTPEGETVDVDHAISADGSRIFWSDGSGQVYVRIDGKETVEIKDPDHGQFLTATPDGSKVLLSDGCLYSLASKSCEATLGNDPSAFLGILGASEDLSRIYFVDKGALVAGAQAGSCDGQGESAKSEGKVPPGHGCNIYVFDHGDFSPVATLIEGDNRLGHFGDWKASPAGRTAQVSADGRYLTFMSKVQLTGYDNRRADGRSCYGSIGPPCFEVYQYDLKSQSLSCASCNPTEQRPLGGSNLSLTREERAPFPQLRNLPSEGEGQVFFESTDVLSAADHNGRIQDIYEWQPNGIGGCNRPKGCISLISSGENSSDSFFLTSSPSGDDAFFISRAQLLLRDKDDLFDVYDARVGGGINENTPPPCLGEACKGPATTPPEGKSAGSAQFSGPGNEKPHKKKGHKHRKKHKHKKKAHKRAAKHNRGGQK